MPNYGGTAVDTYGNFVTVVEHGATASTARPAGAIRVFWRGTVAPTNAVQYDRWINTTSAPYVESIFNGTTWDVLGSSTYVPQVPSAGFSLTAVTSDTQGGGRGLRFDKASAADTHFHGFMFSVAGVDKWNSPGLDYQNDDIVLAYCMTPTLRGTTSGDVLRIGKAGEIISGPGISTPAGSGYAWTWQTDQAGFLAAWQYGGSFPILRISNAGKMSWGLGSSDTDVSLGRGPVAGEMQISAAGLVNAGLRLSTVNNSTFRIVAFDQSALTVMGTTNNTDLYIGTNTTFTSTPSNPAIRITPTSSVVIGKPGIATTATDGFPYIPAAAGAPTGVPTARTGFCPLYFDTTNNKLWIYNGAWKGVVVA